MKKAGRGALPGLDELGFAPLDATGSQLFFRFIAAGYERRSLGIASHWPFDQWGRFLPDETTAVSMIGSHRAPRRGRRHRGRIVPHERSQDERGWTT